MKKLFVFLVLLLLPKAGNAIELIGDLYYNLDLNNHTAEVTRNFANKYTASSFVIPESITFNGISYRVTGIADYAFYNCTNLNAVTIPSSVKTIGSAAFDGCALSAVVIPEGVTSIDSYAFERCTQLTSITIPNSVENIGKDAFYNTAWYDNQPDGLVYAGKVAYKYKGTMPTNLGIVIGSGTLCIAGGCFYNCSGLASVIIPRSVKIIGDNAFYNCTNLSSVSIPYGVNSIGNDAFFRCNGLTSITIPGSVKSIGRQAFYRCDELTSVTILDGVENIGDYVFAYCNKLASITIPNSVTTIGRDVFEHTAWLISQPDEVVYVGKIAYMYNGWMPNNTSIVLKEGTTTIHDELFSRCYGLTSVTIPNSVTTIGNKAFSGCSSLVSAFIPKDVTKIGGGIFNRCTSLESIVVDPDNKYYDSRNNCNAIIETASNTLLTGCKNTVIPNGVTQLAGDAFIGCIGLTSVIIPHSVTSIGSGTFQGCTGLTSLVIPNSVTSISNEKSGGFFLDGCTGLETILVEQGNPIYDSRDNCNAIIETSTNKLIAGCKNTFIPESVTSIGNEAFDSCTGIQDLFCYAKDVPDANGSSFYGWNLASLVLHVPATSVDTYKATAPWSDFKIIVPIEEGEQDDLQRYLNSLTDTEDSFVDGMYTRQFKNDDWQALYVPFTLDYSSWADRFEVASIGNFWLLDDNGDGTADRQLLVATIVESGSLQPNFPYLIRSKSKTGGTLTIVPSSVAEQRITVASLELPACVCTFTGNYSHLTGLKSASRYRLAGGSLSIPDSDDEVLLPYRWYMTIDNATTQDVRLCIVDGETTGIDNLSPLTIHRSPSEQQRPWVVDLSGRRVDADAKSLPKGVYIIDGRKCVVK